MAIRTLLLGRAGSGKTRTLTDRVARYLLEGRERDVLLLVPTLSQANHLKRLFLSRYEDLRGFFDESVVTFTSLVEKILPAHSIGELLSGLRQDLLLREILLREGPASFRPFARYPGFRRAALAFLKELKQNGLPAGEIAGRLTDLAAARGGATASRLLSFRDLFLAYERRRTDLGLIDHEDSLREARDAMARGEGRLSLAYLGADGFQNFTELERDLLLLTADRAEETVVTLPFDPALESEGGGHFRVASETYHFFLERGFSRRTLRENHRARDPALVHLEAGLFRPGTEPVAAGEAVRALQAADPEDEADRVARTVRRLVAGDFGRAYRYRDIVVLLREVSGREERFRRAFRRHGLPLRIHGGDPLSGHPYLRSALDLLRVASGSFSAPRILALLRSDHLPEIRPADVDRLEFDLLEFGPPSGPRAWVERVRRFSEAGAEVLEACRKEPGVDLVDRLLVPLYERDLSDPERAEREAGAVTWFRRAVEELRGVTRGGAGPLPLPESTALLAEILRGAVAGPRDRRLDTVNLIGAREARQWEAPVVLVAGLVEGEFPRAPREDLFLRDEDRRYANSHRRLSLRERALDREEERYLFYVALTRARERLFLVWPATDGRGRETLRSLFLTDALALLHLEVDRHRLSEALPREQETATREDLRRRALLGLGTPYRPGTPEEDRARLAAALADRLLKLPDPAYRRAAALGAHFLDPPPGRLDAPRSLARPRPRSPSALEDFAACPFRHFAGRILRLAPPPRPVEEGLDRGTLGTIAHAALSRLFAGGLPDPAAVPEVVDEVFREVAPAAEGLAADRARRRLTRALTTVAAGERSRLEATSYRPRYLETAFGTRERPLTVSGEGEEAVALRGRIDRIDVAPDQGAVVIDYKYSERGFDKDRREGSFEGTSFQLPVYLLAVREAFGLRPRGAWLLPLLAPKTGGFAHVEGPRPDSAATLTDKEMEQLLGSCRRAVLEIDRRIRSGEIGIEPRDPRVCRSCPFPDLCRYEGGSGE